MQQLLQRLRESWDMYSYGGFQGVKGAYERATVVSNSTRTYHLYLPPPPRLYLYLFSLAHPFFETESLTE